MWKFLLINTIYHLHVHAKIIIRIVFHVQNYKYVSLSSAWPLFLWWMLSRRWQKGTALLLYAFVREKLTLNSSWFLVSISLPKSGFSGNIWLLCSCFKHFKLNWRHLSNLLEHKVFKPHISDDAMYEIYINLLILLRERLPDIFQGKFLLFGSRWVEGNSIVFMTGPYGHF